MVEENEGVFVCGGGRVCEVSACVCVCVCVCLKENKRVGNGVCPLSIEWRLLCSYYFTWTVTVYFPLI